MFVCLSITYHSFVYMFMMLWLCPPLKTIPVFLAEVMFSHKGANEVDSTMVLLCSIGDCTGCIVCCLRLPCFQWNLYILWTSRSSDFNWKTVVLSNVRLQIPKGEGAIFWGYLAQ